MNKVTLIVLSVLAIGAAAAVFLIDEDVEPPPLNEALFPEVLKEDVSEISWSVLGVGETIVRREEGDSDAWQVVIEGHPVPGAKLLIEEVLNELKRARIERKLTGDEASAANRQEYLLEPAAHRIRFVMRGQVAEVRIGKHSLMQDTVYAMIPVAEGTQEVLVIGNALLNSVKDLTAVNLRSRRILDWSVTEMQSVTIRKDGKTRFTAARDEKEKFIWRAGSPFKAFVDPHAMESELLPAFIGLEADEFPADNIPDERLEEFGLLNPRYEIAFTSTEGAKPRTIQIGDRPEGSQDSFYFMEDGRPFVYLGKSPEVLAKLADDPSDWRDRNITRLGWSPIERVSVRLGDTSFEMQRQHDEWHLTKPLNALLEQGATNAWLATVKDAEAIDFADEPDLAALGFDDPTGEITFWKPVPDVHLHGEDGDEGGDEEEAEALPILKLLVGRGAGDRAGVWVMRDGEPGTAYLADGALLDLIAKGHYPLKQLPVFIGLGVTDRKISRIVQTVDGETTDLTAVDGKWPDGARLAAVTSVVAKLLDLKAERWIGPGEGMDEAYGLGDDSHLSLRVYLDVGEGEPMEVGVDVGKQTEGGRFARAFRDGEASADVFIIKPRLTDPVTEVVDEDTGATKQVDRGLQVPLRD